MTKKYIITQSQLEDMYTMCRDDPYGIPAILRSLKPVEPMTLKEITKIYDDTEGLDFYLNFARAIEQRIVGELK